MYGGNNETTVFYCTEEEFEPEVTLKAWHFFMNSRVTEAGGVLRSSQVVALFLPAMWTRNSRKRE